MDLNMVRARERFRMRILWLVVLYAVLAASGCDVGKAAPAAANTLTGIIPHRIAHAGGGIDNKTYTNSYEALDSNLEKGFLYFELDFSFTADGQLVCLHDWKKNFRQSFGFKADGKVSLKEFERLVDRKAKFRNCTLNGLADWMETNPTAYIITDVKENNIKALKIIHDTLPDARNRVIPQIYNPHNFETVKSIGYEQIIWTLYRFKGSNSDVLNWIENFYGSIGITMPRKRAKSTLPLELKKRNIPTYVHTINSVAEFEKFVHRFGVTEIYTDFMPPTLKDAGSKNALGGQPASHN